MHSKGVTRSRSSVGSNGLLQGAEKGATVGAL